MRNLSVLFLLLPGILLSGCADTGALNLGKTVVDGEQVVTIVGDIKDASVQKEALYLNARTARDKYYKQMYGQSGFNVEFEMREVIPGVHIQVMKKVAFKEAPRFDQPMPDGPSIHPAWHSLDNVVDKGTNLLLWWTGITQGVDLLKNAQDKSTPQYYGPYQPVTNSYNPSHPVFSSVPVAKVQ
jgi:hypothetical protein